MKDRAGTFYTNGRVENHVDRRQSAEINKMLVDSRAKKLVAGGPILAAQTMVRAANA